MKTKMIFAIAALLMLGSVSLNAQENSDANTSPTPKDYSQQPFTIVPLEKDLRVDVWGNCGPNTCNSVKMCYSYDLGQTWKMIISDVNWFRVNVGQKLSFKIEENNARSSDGISVRNINSEDTQVGGFYVEGDLGTMRHTGHGKDFFSGMTSLESAENLIIPDNYTCESMFSGCSSLTKAPVLSASKLTENRYKNMFKGCSKLNYIKCLATDISASGCTDNWVYGVSSSGTFVKASSMNNWPSGASGIPSGWTVTNAQAKQTKRTIHVATAGTLPNLISEDEKYEIEELTLTGELNGTDFKFIREMAGDEVSYKKSFWAEVYHNPTEGILTSLDISNAKIVKGGENYNYYISFYDVVGLSTIDDKITVGLFSQTNLKSIILPNTVTSIDEGISYSYMVSTGGTLGFDGEELEIGHIYVFPTCLTSITIPSSVTSIGYGALSGTAWYYNQPNGLVYAGKVAYNYKGEMPVNSSITIMDGTLGIAGGAFSGCSGMSSVTIPNTVTNVGGNAFYGCNSLTKVVSKIKNPFKIDASVFPSDIYSNAELVVPAGTKSLYEATEGWNKFSKITESPAVKRTIHVSTAGTLSDLISEDEKYEIEELTLTGELNGTDFKFIREMAGDEVSYTVSYTGYKSSYYVHHNPTEGILTSLDITNARIVKGGDAYFYYIYLDRHVGSCFTRDNAITPGLFTRTKLESILLPNSVTSISGMTYSEEYTSPSITYMGAFPHWLKSVTIPQSVTSINPKAFSGCTSLNSIKIESGNQYYDSRNDCNAIIETNTNSLVAGCKNTIIPNSVTSIGDDAFCYCIDLASITIPNSVTSICSEAFYGCSGLTSITIPNSVTSIGDRAFYKCSGLNSVTIGNSVTSICSEAFYGCSGLTSITIPNSVTSIGDRAFYKCSGLTSITIPNGVTSIGSAAFCGCSGLTSITIPNSVTSIDDSAFSYCSSLTSVNIPNSVTSISRYAFSNCSGLTSISIPSSVTSIGDGAFCGCSGLTSIMIPNSVTSIYSEVFYNCNGLTSIMIPNSVTSIGENAFHGTAWYDNQPNGLVYAGKVAYKYKGEIPANASITITDGTLGIADGTFSGCNGLTSIDMPNSVTFIGYRAFYGCSGLASVNIPNSVTSIDLNAFDGCSGLTSVNIPSSVTSIGWYAFQGCSGLTKVVSKIKNPFKINASVFPSDIYTNAELVVPTGTKSLYEATECWNRFSEITELLPTLETLPAQPTSTTKARLIALANEEDDDQHYGFEWLRNDAPQEMPANKVSAPLYEGRIIGSLGGLNPDIYYKYRPFYKADTGEMVYGEWIPFITGDANVFFEPETHTKEADRVTATGAHLSGVWIEGTDDIQEKGFEYWTVSGSKTRGVGGDVKKIVVSGNQTSATLEGLKAGITYGYRSYIVTAKGTTYSEDEKTFQTILIGDVDDDGKLTNADADAIAKHIIGQTPSGFNKKMADVNNDGDVNVIDIVLLVKMISHAQP